jgi:dolichol kinase
MYQEWKRQLVHIALFGAAFLLRYLTRPQAVLFLLVLVIGVVWLVPRSRLRLHLFRPRERAYAHGALWYVLTLVVVAVMFPLPIVAATWGVLALGDGMATLIGQSAPRQPLPWNRKKSLAGSLAFMCFGALGCAVLLKWMLPELSWVAVGFIGVRTAIVAAIIESLPLPIDDNVTVPLASAAVLAFLINT